MQASGTGQGCVPVLPLNQCDMHSRPEPGSLPQDHAGSGVVAPWLLLGQLHSIEPVIAVLPRVLCVYWGFHSWWCSRQQGGLHGLLNLAISTERHGCHRPPPGMPVPGIDPTTLQS